MGYDHHQRQRQQGSYESAPAGQSDASATFRGIHNSNARWVESAHAMVVLERECQRLGVEFIAGESGPVTGFIRDAHDSKTIIGVRTANRTTWRAKKVIVSVGAYSEHCSTSRTSCTRGYPVTHIRMTEEQYQRYKDLPVVAITRRGYFFPPNEGPHLQNLYHRHHHDQPRALGRAQVPLGSAKPVARPGIPSHRHTAASRTAEDARVCTVHLARVWRRRDREQQVVLGRQSVEIVAPGHKARWI
ncbi:hypothetical protein F5884DRAFT_863109 [Xylogone sp. PMI_703]|nr:hypothetical protein F5884DRAFT_863109 [Xylogone sp. PMI_703]